MTEYAATQSLAGKGKTILANALPTEPRAEILMSAAGCILGDRTKDYGPPEDNFANIVSLWNAYLEMRKQRVPTEPPEAGEKLDGADQAVMMALMKIARIATNPGHKDSWIDAAGYLACGWRCVKAAMAEPLKLEMEQAALEQDQAKLDSLIASDATWEPEDGAEADYACGCPVCEPGDWPKKVVEVETGEVDYYDVIEVPFPEEGCPCEVCTCHDDLKPEADGDTTLWPTPGGMTFGEAKQKGKGHLFITPWDHPLDGDRPAFVEEVDWGMHLEELEEYSEGGDGLDKLRTRWYTPWDARASYQREPYKGVSCTYAEACRYQRRQRELKELGLLQAPTA